MDGNSKKQNTSLRKNVSLSNSINNFWGYLQLLRLLNPDCCLARRLETSATQTAEIKALD